MSEFIIAGGPFMWPLLICSVLIISITIERLWFLQNRLVQPKGLTNQIINLFQFILIVYIILTWLVNFNIINTGNRFVYTILDALYRLCEPSLNFVRRYLPTFGAIDLSPIVVYLGLWFIKSLLIEYWPR